MAETRNYSYSQIIWATGIAASTICRMRQQISMLEAEGILLDARPTWKEARRGSTSTPCQREEDHAEDVRRHGSEEALREAREAFRCDMLARASKAGLMKDNRKRERIDVDEVLRLRDEGLTMNEISRVMRHEIGSLRRAVKRHEDRGVAVR